MRLFGKPPREHPEDQAPIAHRINFSGPAPYARAFENSGFGVVFEDDGETGYFYATDEGLENALDALHLYNAGDEERVNPGDEVYVVWSPTLQKVGLFYHDQFQAVVDFKNQQARCRTGFPPSDMKWCKSSHDWNETIIGGLEP